MCIQNQIHESIKYYLPEPQQLHHQLAKDESIMYQYGICVQAVKLNPKYKQKRKYRMKIEAIKNQFIDCFLSKEIKRIQIIVKIKNDLISEYFKKVNSYDYIMEELDKLLVKPVVKPDPQCNCRNEGFGFCFCCDDNGNYLR